MATGTNSYCVLNLTHKPKSAIQSTTKQKLGAQEQPKISLFSDILKRKTSNTVIKKRSSETNIQTNIHPTNTIQCNSQITKHHKYQGTKKNENKTKRRRIIETPNQIIKTGSAIP